MVRWVGMQVGRHVSFAWRMAPALFVQKHVRVGDHSLIGYNTAVLAHEYVLCGWRSGPVQIGADLPIGAHYTILPGTVIGDGTVISATTFVNRDVAPGARVGGAPIRVPD